MNTLSIPQIFQNLSYYQAHYLEILQDSSRYYTPVADAVIHLWPTKAQALYLGDLLQLWFSEKWHTEQQRAFGFEIFLELPENTPAKKQFIYALHGNLLTGEHQAFVSQADGSLSESSSLVNVSKYYSEFKALSRPKLLKNPVTLQFDVSLYN